MSTYSPAPVFAAGQYASAGAHLQALGDNCNALLGLYLAPATLWTSYACGGPEDWWEGEGVEAWKRVFSGVIRHKKDTLTWKASVTVDANIGATLRLQYGTAYATLQTVTAGSGTGNYEGTVNLAVLSPAPTVGQFYECHIDFRATAEPYGDVGETTITLLALYESDEQSYSTLASFIAGTTPTAAQWQALSTRADTLAAQAGGARAPFVGGIGGTGRTIWRGALEYLHRYLYYDVRIRPPYSDGTTTATLTVNGFDYVLGSRTTPTDRYPATHAPDEGDTGDEDEGFSFFTHRGTVDLSALGLSEGGLYTASVSVSHSGDSNLATAKLLLLSQQPPATASVVGWTNPPTFVRGTTVGGAGSMKVIRDDLTWLSSRLVYRNPATMQHRLDYTMPQRSVRRRRWLHYRCDLPDYQPSLGWWDGTAWQETSLSYEPAVWQKFDMAGAKRLWEGGVYRVRDVSYMLEDDDA